jgi:hypothetical protein
MPVILEAAGDHDFDLAHIRREGGEELVRRLLERVELPPHALWRVQVQKKLNCNAETPPVRVVDEPRKWAVHLKIKPGDNNTCHLCSLLMPDGYSGEKLYYQLGKASAEIDRNWRHKTMEPSNGMPNGRAAELFPPLPSEAEHKPPQPVESTPQITPPRIAYVAPPAAPPPQAEPVPAATEVPTQPKPSEPATATTGRTRGWLNDPDKIRLLLLAIHELNETGAYPQDHWADLLGQRMNWAGANRHEVGGVLTGLVRRNFIERRFRGSKPYGYVLSEEGEREIAELLRAAPAPVPAPPPAAAAAPPPTPVQTPANAPLAGSDPAEIIRSFGPIAKHFLDAHTRLESIAQREEDLLTELDLLKEEREQICHFLDDHQVQSVLVNLARLVQVKV